MVVKMTVLSFCTEAECGFQSETSAASKVVGAVSTALSSPGRSIRATLAAPFAVFGGMGLLLATAISGPPEETIEAEELDEEEKFKEKFVAHVTKKQQLIIDSTSDNCSNQVEQ